MADIAPIRGVLYDPKRVTVAHVIAPPYDVISETERSELEASDPHNVVRLILPRGGDDEKYATAARLLAAWLDTGVLVRDKVPAIYRYDQTYTSGELGPSPVTRRGFIAAVRLHRFDEGVILPHERTLRGPKVDRLKLMRATRAHFSQIFGLYPDPLRRVDSLLEAVCAPTADLEGRTADGTTHKLWRVTDRAALGAVAAFLSDRKIYIADGHHRYETMLALRDELGGSPMAATRFATMFLCNMGDPGLVVLPTHRLVHSIPDFERARFLHDAAAQFEITEVPGGAPDALRLRAAIADRARLAPTFAVVFPDDTTARLFSLRPGAAGPGAPAVAALDVTVLHTLILERLLGIDRNSQEAQRNITYVKDTADALRRMAATEAQVGFIMHPTQVAQVRDVADAGEVMPQKSTYFYPKIASGLVIGRLDPGEELERLP